MMELRWYQQAARTAVWAAAQRHEPGLVVLPTGSGKSPLIGQLALDVVQTWGGRVLCLSHRKELIEQTAGAIGALCGGQEVGIYSAALKRSDADADLLVAGIQSVYQRACELGRRDTLIIDECHLLSGQKSESMYRQLLDDMRVVAPHCQLIGLSATPYRMGEGRIYGPGQLFPSISFEVGVRQLIAEGFLSHLVSRSAECQIDTEGVRVARGDFVRSALEQRLDDGQRIALACHEILDRAVGRRSTLVFCAGRAHGHAVLDQLRVLDPDRRIEYLDGATPAAQRRGLIRDFRAGEIQMLVTVDLATTGLDVPGIDCVALLRPTMSPGLYVQMVGRGFRLAPEKQNCLVLDFGGNIRRFGPVDRVVEPAPPTPSDRAAPMKTCANCHELCYASATACPSCGMEFPASTVQHSITASRQDVLTGTAMTSEVQHVIYSVHRRRRDDQSESVTLRVDYEITGFAVVSQWICVQHEGRPRWEAEQWWSQRSKLPCPRSAEEAAHIGNHGGLAMPKKITYRREGQFTRVLSAELGDIPDGVRSRPMDRRLEAMMAMLMDEQDEENESN